MPVYFTILLVLVGLVSAAAGMVTMVVGVRYAKKGRDMVPVLFSLFVGAIVILVGAGFIGLPFLV